MKTIRAMLRIVRITGRTNKRTYTAEDVFTAEFVTILISGKQLMYFGENGFSNGDECVAMFNPYEPTHGRIVTPSNFKMDNHNNNWMAQAALKTRYKKEIGPYETDYNWFHRPTKENASKKPPSNLQETTPYQQITSRVIRLRKSLNKWLKP
jgi:hypothetical protein